MVPRMIVDSFSIDVYCSYLNLPSTEELVDDSERNRSMSLETAQNRLVTQSKRSLGFNISRLIWLVIGPCLLMIICVLKLESRSGGMTSLDAGFAMTAAGMIVVRWITYLFGDRFDSFGARMRMSGLLRFSGLVLVAASGAWVLASFIATQNGS